MKDGRIIDPVRLLKKMYRQDFALPEKDLLQLQSQGAIHSFSLAAGEQLSLQGRNGKDSLYLLIGEVDCHTEKDPQSHLDLNRPDKRPFALGETGTVTLVAKQDSLLSQVDQDQLDYLVSWKSLLDAGRQDNDITSRIASLRNPSIFRQLPFENIEQAFKNMAEIDVMAGDEIVRQGDPAELFYIIKKGSAQVLQQGIYDDKQQEVAVLGVGEHFGDEALVHGGARNATVRMLDDGCLLVLKKEDFQSLIHSELASQVNAEQARDVLQQGAILIDVRYEEEFHDLHLQDARLYPLPELRQRLDEFDEMTQYIVYCDSTRRSAVAAMILKQAGCKAFYLKGGVREWPYEIVDQMGTQKTS